MMPIRYTKQYINATVANGGHCEERAADLIGKAHCDRNINHLVDRYFEAKENFLLVHSNLHNAHSRQEWHKIIQAQSDIYAYAMTAKEYANCLNDEEKRQHE